MRVWQGRERRETSVSGMRPRQACRNRHEADIVSARAMTVDAAAEGQSSPPVPIDRREPGEAPLLRGGVVPERA